MATDTTLLPLPDAAARLGLSQSALRRRLRSGKARGERRPTSSGFMWWVSVDGGTPTDERGAPTPPRTPTATQDARPPGPTTLAVQAARAEEMARYSHELLSPVLARLEAQAEELGHVRAQLEHARARIAELETRSAPPAGEHRAGRRWWRRWWD